MSEESYKGGKIQVKEIDNVQRLYIDDKEIELIFDGTSGTYSCQTLPYARYSSHEELGRAIIDNQ